MTTFAKSLQWEKYYNSHREKEISRVMQWKQRNRDRVYEYMREWRDKNPQRVREYQRKWLTPKPKTKCQRCGILMNEELCQWCKKELNI